MITVVVIGAGAAGLMAVYALEKALANVPHSLIISDKNSRPARKVMITGKGRCNVTNNTDLQGLISNVSHNSKFLYSAFCDFSSSDTMGFFERNGVPLKTERGNRVFPVSDKAVDIVDALSGIIPKSARLVTAVKTLEKLPDGKFCVEFDDRQKVMCDCVLISTGGASYPLTGSTGDGFEFAKNFGHTVIPLEPSLVPVECKEYFCSKLSGLSLRNVTLSLYEENKNKPLFSELGEMLFTHFGVSGPLVLSASAHFPDNDAQKYRFGIDLKPGLTSEQLDKRLLRDFSENSNRDFINSLDKLLPKSLIPAIVTLSGIPKERKVNQISREERQKLISVIKCFTLHILRKRPIEEAIITRGGVSVKEIKPSSMESKIVDGLYFAGEIIDVDAYTGGFNLQIAFSTGYLAGKSMGERFL